MNAKTPRCDACGARTRSTFCERRGALLGRLAPQGTVHLFRRGQFLFHAGTPALALHVVRSGRVKVSSAWRNGEEIVLRLLGAGELLGYRPLLANEPYNASAEVIEDASVCIFPASGVRTALRSDPALALELLGKLARELRLSEELMMDLVHRPVRERTARLLLGWFGSDGAAVESVFSTRALSRKDMARMIGTTPETLSRVLREFAARGLIELTRAHLRVRDAAKLERAAGPRGT